MLAIVWASHAGAVRFNEFRQSLGEIPPRTLAARLAELEQAGVLERRVIDARPPRVEYRLTERGRRLRALVEALDGWAASRA
jgi:DNA-binding HxlR family transcriptional regulator